MKNKVLFILHMPPPVHGAAMMGKYIYDSQVINGAFGCRYFNLTLAKNLQDIGKGGIRKLRNFIRQLGKIRTEVRTFQPDLCYVTPNAKGGAFYKDFVVVMMLKAMGQKVVVHYHNKGVATRQNRILDNWLYQRFFRNLKVILLAKPLYQDICKYVKEKDVHFCPNGIPVQQELPVRINHEGFNILFLSNMMEEKGVWDLVEACRILMEKGKKFHCHFVGKWSDISKEEFQQKIHLLNLENCISAYGGKYGNEKEIYFQKADVFVLPTHNECFPLVLLEAMEHELPCISTQEGGIAAIIDEGKTGYVVERKNPQALAGKIERLIDQPALCKAMGIAGKEKLNREFTLNKFECKLRDILQEISGSRN